VRVTAIVAVEVLFLALVAIIEIVILLLVVVRIST